MNFYVIKLKHIIIALLIFAVIPIIWFTTSRAVSVFNVNGREIPIYSVERCDNKIALTFDCAWNDDDIDSILDTLDKYNCKATFFVVGDWAEKYSESLKKIYDRGHEIGNHSYNHADYTKMSAEAITADLVSCLTTSFTPLSAYSFLTFVLLYVPCIAAVSTLRSELNSRKLTAFSVLYQLSVAWIMSTLVFQIGNLFV